MRRAPVAIAVTLAALTVVAVAGIIALRPPAELATPSPSPSPSPAASPATTTSAATSPSPSPIAIPSPTTSPSPTPQGQYVSKRLGIALTLPPPWRKASCGNSEPGPDRKLVFESFTSGTVMQEHLSGVGSATDRVVVQANSADGLTPTQYAQRLFPGTTLVSVTFAGRSAVEVRHQTFGMEESIYYYLADGDRIYTVGYDQRVGGSADIATMIGIVRSFRFVSPAERAATPDPAAVPAPAPTTRALASMLKVALEQKDLTAIERLLGPCVSGGVRPGGGASQPRERFVADLRQQFSAGLTVTVDATVSTDPMTMETVVGSRWNAFPPSGGPQMPQPQPLNVQLLIGWTAGGVYWSGTLVVHAS